MRDRLGQELQEVRSSDEDMHHPAAVKEPKPEVSVKCEPKEVLAVVKRPRVSLMSSYRQTWKARHHHFVRYSDVKLKDERRPTVSDLANQKHVMQKIHGWKIYHLSAQIDEMVTDTYFFLVLLSTNRFCCHRGRPFPNRKCTIVSTPFWRPWKSWAAARRPTAKWCASTN